VEDSNVCKALSFHDFRNGVANESLRRELARERARSLSRLPMTIRIELRESLLSLRTTIGGLEATDCQKPSPYNETDVYNPRSGNSDLEAKRWQHPMVLNLHHADRHHRKQQVRIEQERQTSGCSKNNFHATGVSGMVTYVLILQGSSTNNCAADSHPLLTSLSRVRTGALPI